MTAREQADDTLAAIDAVLGPLHAPDGDWEVGPDAMRSRPVDEDDLPEHEPATPFRRDATGQLWHGSSLVPAGMLRSTFDQDVAALRAERHYSLGFDPANPDHVYAAVRPGDRVRLTPAPLSAPRTPDERMADWLDSEADRDQIPDEDRPAYIEHLAGTMRAQAMQLRFDLDQALVDAKATRAGRLLFRLLDWLSSRRRQRQADPESGTITVTITADADRFSQAMTQAAQGARTAFSRMSFSVGEAVIALDRLLATAASHPALRELRLRAARNEIRTLADVHRHELARWWDDHLDHVYADLGLDRPTLTGDPS